MRAQPKRGNQPISQTQHCGRERQLREWKTAIPTADTYKTLWRRKTERRVIESDDNCSNKQQPSLQAWNSRPVRGVRIRNEIQTIKRNTNFKAMENHLEFGRMNSPRRIKVYAKGKALRSNKGKGTEARDVGWLKHKPKQNEGSEEATEGGETLFVVMRA